jgi:hypothetical protein
MAPVVGDDDEALDGFDLVAIMNSARLMHDRPIEPGNR